MSRALDVLRQSLERLQYIEGVLIKDPTAPGLLLPGGGSDGLYGGTFLGIWARIVLRYKKIHGRLTGEEWAGKLFDTIEGGYHVRIAATLRTWNTSAVEVIWPGVTTDAQTGVPGVREDVTTQRGVRGTSLAFKLLFAPDSAEDHPAIYFPACHADTDGLAPAVQSINAESQVPVMFEPFVSDAGLYYQRNLVRLIVL